MPRGWPTARRRNASHFSLRLGRKTKCCSPLSYPSTWRFTRQFRSGQKCDDEVHPCYNKNVSAKQVFVQYTVITVGNPGTDGTFSKKPGDGRFHFRASLGQRNPTKTNSSAPCL